MSMEEQKLLKVKSKKYGNVTYLNNPSVDLFVKEVEKVNSTFHRTKDSPLFRVHVFKHHSYAARPFSPAEDNEIRVVVESDNLNGEDMIVYQDSHILNDSPVMEEPIVMLLWNRYVKLKDETFLLLIHQNSKRAYDKFPQP